MNKNFMKIIQIIPLLDLAGAETMCENLANSLIKLGFIPGALRIDEI